MDVLPDVLSVVPRDVQPVAPQDVLLDAPLVVLPAAAAGDC